MGGGNIGVAGPGCKIIVLIRGVNFLKSRCEWDTWLPLSSLFMNGL